ncbi:MAG: response regulator [Cyclobacteriaceae bacterium]|nr:response regulator [Cyclobacteriaceae bacterium]
MTIYLIEDDDIYAEFIIRALSSAYDVKSFGTAEDCQKALTDGHLPDAFIVDYKLPGITGIDFYDSIKDRLTDDHRLIMMSSIDDGNLVLSFIKKGIRDYVIKDDTVIDSLKAILDGKEDDYYLFN